MDLMDVAILKALKKLNYKEIRPNQKEVIINYLQGKDVFFCSPTGSGKSLTFEVAPFVFSEFLNGETKCVAIVVSPLTALMKTQVRNLKTKGIEAVYLYDEQEQSQDLDTKIKNLTLKDLKDGEFDIVFASPESLLGSCRDLVMQLAKKTFLKIIFIDEAHCIKKFGKSKEGSKKQAYRPSYGCLGELRSLAGPAVPIVALTATASVDTQNLIIKDLCMEGCSSVIADPNKQNMKYWCLSVNVQNGNHRRSFDWLVNLLSRDGIKTPRMIIFFRQIKHIWQVYEHLDVSLGKDAFINFKPEGPNDDRNRLFDMFHQKTDDDVKESICNSYNNPYGSTRVVLCSTSFSMGLDVKGVDYIVHYGPANDVDDYLQETGRAGRDPSQQCHAILIRYTRCLNSQNISKHMKDYVKATHCRRVILLTSFTEKPEPLQPFHKCCDVCSKGCKCLCTCEDLCTCVQLCPKLDSEVVTEITFQHEAESLTDRLLDSDGESSESDFESHIARKPQVIDYSSNEDGH